MFIPSPFSVVQTTIDITTGTTTSLAGLAAQAALQTTTSLQGPQRSCPADYVVLPFAGSAAPSCPADDVSYFLQAPQALRCTADYLFYPCGLCKPFLCSFAGLEAHAALRHKQYFENTRLKQTFFVYLSAPTLPWPLRSASFLQSALFLASRLSMLLHVQLLLPTRPSTLRPSIRDSPVNARVPRRETAWTWSSYNLPRPVGLSYRSTLYPESFILPKLPIS